VSRLRGDNPPVPLTGRTVIVIDAGIATGSTARAACQVEGKAELGAYASRGGDREDRPPGRAIDSQVGQQDRHAGRACLQARSFAKLELKLGNGTGVTPGTSQRAHRVGAGQQGQRAARCGQLAHREPADPLHELIDAGNLTALGNRGDDARPSLVLPHHSTAPLAYAGPPPVDTGPATGDGLADVAV
jgi:hypothetical protein